MEVHLAERRQVLPVTQRAQLGRQRLHGADGHAQPGAQCGAQRAEVVRSASFDPAATRTLQRVQRNAAKRRRLWRQHERHDFLPAQAEVIAADPDRRRSPQQGPRQSLVDIRRDGEVDDPVPQQLQQRRTMADLRLDPDLGVDPHEAPQHVRQ